MDWKDGICVCPPGYMYSTTLALLWSFNNQTNNGAQIIAYVLAQA